MVNKIKRCVAVVIEVFKLLWNSSSSYLIKMCLINTVTGITVSAGIIIWKNILNSVQAGFETGHIKLALYWLCVYFVVLILQKIFDEINNYYKNILSSYTNKYITRQVLDKTKLMEMEKYDDSSLYDKLKKINEESTGRSMNLLNSVGMLIKGLSIAVATAIMLFNFNPLFMFLCVFVSIPSLMVSMNIAVRQYDLYYKRFENLRFIDSVKTLLTNHENIKEIKIYNVSEYFTPFIEKSYVEYIQEDKKIRKKFAIQTISVDSIENFTLFFLKGIVCVKVILEKMSIGQLTLYFGAIDNFRSALVNIMNVIVSMFEDGLYVNNFYDLIKEEFNESSNVKKQGFNSDFKVILFENVSFAYPGSDSYVLKDINIRIEKEKNYAIVGLNGSGKTTLIKLLLRLYKPSKGEIYIDDININDIEISSYYKYVSAIFQDFIKYPLTIGENIGLGNKEKMNDVEKIKQAADKGGSLEFINKLPFSFNTRLQKEWSNSVELSLGQWQKLAISRAFFKNSPIMILDEPSASLDPMAEQDMFLKIKELAYKKTCILIAHRFSTVRLADKIYVLKNGMIVENGSHEDLMKKMGIMQPFFVYRQMDIEEKICNERS